MCHLFPSSLYKWIFLAYSQSQFPYNFSRDWLAYCITESASNSPWSFSSRVYYLKVTAIPFYELAGFGSDIIPIPGYGLQTWYPRLIPQSQAIDGCRFWWGHWWTKFPEKNGLLLMWTPKDICYSVMYFISLSLYKRALIKFNMALTIKSSFSITNFKMMVLISAKIHIIFTLLASFVCQNWESSRNFPHCFL